MTTLEEIAPVNKKLKCSCCGSTLFERTVTEVVIIIDEGKKALEMRRCCCEVMRVIIESIGIDARNVSSASILWRI